MADEFAKKDEPTDDNEPIQKYLVASEEQLPQVTPVNEDDILLENLQSDGDQSDEEQPVIVRKLPFEQPVTMVKQASSEAPVVPQEAPKVIEEIPPKKESEAAVQALPFEQPMAVDESLTFENPISKDELAN